MADFSWTTLQPDSWADFCTLFGAKGACGGCWCMLWRRSGAEMEAGKGAGNRAAMADISAGGHVPGLVAWRVQPC